MTKISQEKLANYRRINETLSNFEGQPEVIRKFMSRMSEEKVGWISTQNLSWMGFFKAPFSHDVDNADITICGCGIDYGTLSETGNMRHAPAYLRFKSRYGIPLHGEWEMAPFEMARIIDMGDIDIWGLNYSQSLDHLSTYMMKAANAGNLLLNFGGEHSVAHAFEPAAFKLAETYFDSEPMGGVLFDGHPDALTKRDTEGYTDEERENANFLTRSIADGLIDPEKFFMFGIKETGSSTLSGHLTTRELGITTVGPLEVFEKGPKYFADMVAERVGDAPCIIECDLDGLDAAESGGGLSTMDGFGLRWQDYRIISRAFKGKNLIGADIVEYAPANDPSGATATNVCNLGFEYLCMLVDTKVRLNGGQHRPTRWHHNLSTASAYPGAG
jgi:arginase family enzyme